MVKEKKDIYAEDRCFVAERKYQRMLDDVSNGKLDRYQIDHAMYDMNIAHLQAIEEKKRHLLK